VGRPNIAETLYASPKVKKNFLQTFRQDAPTPMKKQLFIRKAMKADDENGMQASELSSSTFIN